MSQNLLQQRIEKDIAWTITGLPDKEKQMHVLGSWTSFQYETTMWNTKNLKSITCRPFPKGENSLFVKHILTFW